MNPHRMIRIFNSTEDLARFFALHLETLMTKNRESGPFSIALSGGSTPKKIFDHLAANFRDTIDWHRVLIFWGDERCVPPGDNESNFRMAREALLDRVPVPAVNIFRILGENAPVQESKRYSDLVMKKVSLKDNIPSFDLLMLGLGDDGHTASIFPDSMHLLISDRLFEVSENPYSGQKRITATGKIINHAKNVVFLVTGKSKAEVAARVIEKQEGWENLPASMVYPENGELLWLLDREAALKLDNSKHHE